MSNSKVLFCSIFLCFTFLISFASSSYLNTSLTTIATTTTHQCSTLLRFKQNLSSINDTSHYCQYPVMMNWNTSTDCCYWDGVTCDHFTGDVIGLDLSCGMIQGTLHPNSSLFNLPHLQRLNLAFNDFTGSKLPHEIERFSNTLTHLNISECGFSGQVPARITLLHKLVSLDLTWNYDISLEPRVFINMLQNHTNLEELSLGNVNISSVLPTHLNISSSLKLLKLGNTGLQGKIPHTIFNLQSLEILKLSDNNLIGQIPWEISLLPKLVSLSLYWNFDLRMKPHIFNGLLQNSSLLRDLWLSDVNIGLVLPTYLNISFSLKTLDLMNTGLKGKLPDNIFNLRYLEALDLSVNRNLIGPLPRVNATIPLKRLYLSSINVSGKIPDSIGHFKSLTLLDLSSTNLSGEIPDTIGHLKSLTYLDLSYCNYMGPLPKSLVNLRHLTFLRLSSNKLNGTLPSWLFSLQSLKQLYLQDNQFVGQIDVLDEHEPNLQTFRQLTNLTDLELSFNNFSGVWELDTLLSSLTNLETLDLSYSGLSVTTSNSNHHVNPNLWLLYLASCKIKVFPESLRSMRNLGSLDLSSNEIHGKIPQWAGEIGGSKLYNLNLSHNFITGLPQFQWYGLEYLYLQSNLIKGQFPPSVCNMNSLSYLDMSNNSFDGVIPECLGNITSSLRMINLWANRFRGPFPQSICKMRNLWFLDLSNNWFDGVIPECFGNITPSLTMIKLENNHFQGTIPNVYENCGGLEGLLLNGNQLEGEVPSSMSKCQSLKVLDMGNNHLNGTFPHWLGSLPYLQVLILKLNHFHGHIVPSSTVGFPFPTLQVIDLSHNGFEGQLPQKYFQNFNAMKNSVKRRTEPKYLFVGNQFYSFVVSVKGVEQDFPQLYVHYTIICLSHNNFVGEIPDIIGSLNSLVVLNLSLNNLTGQIPHALGKLSEIESLDLSCNQLIGKIPQSLADLTFLEFLNLSQNHLVGLIPVGKQLKTFQENSFEGNLNLCRLPLPKECNKNPQETHIEGNGDGDEEESGLWRVVMLGYGCGTLFGLVMGYLMLSTGRPIWFNAIAYAVEQMILKRRNKRIYYI